MSYKLKRLECEVERLKVEEEFVREKAVFSSVAIDDLIYFTTVTPEPLGNSDKPYHFRSRLEKQRTCLTLLFCLKKCYPSIYQYLRTKICEPVILENGFQWVEQKNKKGLIGKMKNVFGKQEQQIWWKSRAKSDLQTRDIEKELLFGKHEKVKLLLWGTERSGKSTLMKQLQMQYLGGVSVKERLFYKRIIHKIIIESMQTLVHECEDYIFEDTYTAGIARKVSLLPNDTVIGSEVGECLKKLWDNDEIQKCLKSFDLGLPCNIKYFFDNIDKISSFDYVSSDDDILRCHVKMSGAIDKKFSLKNRDFIATEVNNCRTERSKWIHCFENLSLIVFMLDVSLYDEGLIYESDINPVREAMKSFDSLVNSRWFCRTPVLLVLNKMDVFKKKIITKDLKCCFPEYTGGFDCAKVCEFLKNKFTRLDCTEGVRRIYNQECCAIDKKSVEEMMNVIVGQHESVIFDI